MLLSLVALSVYKWPKPVQLHSGRSGSSGMENPHVEALSALWKGREITTASK